MDGAWVHHIRQLLPGRGGGVSQMTWERVPTGYEPPAPAKLERRAMVDAERRCIHDAAIGRGVDAADEHAWDVRRRLPRVALHAHRLTLDQRGRGRRLLERIKHRALTRILRDEFQYFAATDPAHG